MSTPKYFDRVLHERSCCDGLCTEGHDCPAIRAIQARSRHAFAPGVIEVHRPVGRLRRALRALAAWAVELSEELCR